MQLAAEGLGVQVEEIKINVPWGYVCGKWWGPRNIRPIVCIHGWQDNAGTFDTLIPLLPRHLGYLALDLPGHGKSSWLPDGTSYYSSDYVILLVKIMKYYGWKKLSLLGHSMGALCCFSFSSILNDKVDLVIALDALQPIVEPADLILQIMRHRLPLYIVAAERNRSNTEPPSYTYDELIEKFYNGTYYSVDREHCKYILNRNIAESKKDPTKFYFSRDSRLKYLNYGVFSKELNITLAEEIKCPYLYIKALDSMYEGKQYYDECPEVFRKNPNFEGYDVQGTHHVHLNDPAKVSGFISDFINKWRPPQLTSKL